jgi:hypothetical protein
MNIANWICAAGFIACSIGGIIEGANILSHAHRWGFIALAVAFGLAGIIGIIRNATFSARGQDDTIFFLADFTESTVWTLLALVLVTVGIICFFVSPPF